MLILEKIIRILLPPLHFTRLYGLKLRSSSQNPGSLSSYLLSGDAHVILHIRENSGLNEEPFRVHSFASTLHLGPFTDAALDEPQHAILLLPADLWRWRTDVIREARTNKSNKTRQRKTHFESER